MKTTQSLVQVALALMSRPTERHWGYELGKQSGVRSGVLYPMLTRMLDEGWLTDGWEDPRELNGRHSPRRYYTITEKGLQELGALKACAASDPRFQSITLGWAR